MSAVQSGLQREIAGELEWLNKNAKGQQKKGKARLRRYEDLVEQVIVLLQLLCLCFDMTTSSCALTASCIRPSCCHAPMPAIACLCRAWVQYR